ncbi:MAG: copper amine oxidase N-terminal domain-containing protein [Defluviitaleaceae bacterium]|nr:copper amine oxidase N-terminal domain-containing protein [Defluviitaleaceae bacterium]
MFKILTAVLLSVSLPAGGVSVAAAQAEERPMFMAFGGRVMETYPVPNNEGEPIYGHSLMRITSPEAGTAMFATNTDTFVLGEEPQNGDEVTGFYLADAPMILIYPPHYTIRVLVNGDFANVAVDRFCAEADMGGALVSSDGMLQLNFGEDTAVVCQDGQTFDGELDGRLLAVVYGAATRSIPAITLPDGVEKIVVLRELNAQEPEIREIDDGFADVDLIWTSNLGVFIHGQHMGEAFTWRQVESSILVPVRAVAQELGAELSWDYDTREVVLIWDGERIVFSPGSYDFTRGEENISLTQPSLLINETTYVPLSFFREVLGMNNAYIHAGEVHINNNELMR